MGTFDVNSPEKISFEIAQGYQPGCIGWVVGMHGRVYVGDRRWNARFEQIVGTELIAFFEQYDDTKDGFWMARVNGAFAASIAVVSESASRARIRFFVADPAFVGRGLGKSLLQSAMKFCAAGQKDIYLTTVKGLEVARHLYEKAGFVLVDEHEDRSWGAPMREQRYERKHARA
jgi:GNAT superfamily N-acetyltransferase